MSNLRHEPHADEGGQADSFAVERASAVPTHAAAVRRRKNVAASPMHKTAGSPPLAKLQASFLAALTHPKAAGQATDASPLTSVLSGATGVEGLEVYRYAYRARLIEALADDFPTVQYAMGATNFARFAGHVVTENPSRTRNLNRYGRAFVDALDHKMCKLRHRLFLSELAQLEWALVEAVHARPPDKLHPHELATIPQESWGELVFTPSPSLLLLRTQYPVNGYLQAFRNGAQPPLPVRTKHSFATAIYREGFRVWRMDLSPIAAGLLERLVRGDSLGAALCPLEGVAESANVMRWFEMWVRGGVFSAVRLP